jgi:hypothetical protein
MVGRGIQTLRVSGGPIVINFLKNSLIRTAINVIKFNYPNPMFVISRLDTTLLHIQKKHDVMINSE